MVREKRDGWRIEREEWRSDSEGAEAGAEFEDEDEDDMSGCTIEARCERQDRKENQGGVHGGGKISNISSRPLFLMTSYIATHLI